MLSLLCLLQHYKYILCLKKCVQYLMQKLSFLFSFVFVLHKYNQIHTLFTGCYKVNKAAQFSKSDPLYKQDAHRKIEKCGCSHRSPYLSILQKCPTCLNTPLNFQSEAEITFKVVPLQPQKISSMELCLEKKQVFDWPLDNLKFPMGVNICMTAHCIFIYTYITREHLLARKRKHF